MFFLPLLWATLERASALFLHLSNAVSVLAAVREPGKNPSKLVKLQKMLYVFYAFSLYSLMVIGSWSLQSSMIIAPIG